MFSSLIKMNYYVVHPLTQSYVSASGAPTAHLATIIGAPNLSAFFASMIHCWILSKESSTALSTSQRLSVLRRLFLCSSFFGVVGNVVHGVAVVRDSVPLTVVGRFLYGFSLCEILSREVIGYCLPSHVVEQSARIFRYKVFGMIAGLLFASFLEAIHVAINSYGVGVFQATSWSMAALWMVHFIRLYWHFHPIKAERRFYNDVFPDGDGKVSEIAIANDQYDSDSSNEGVASPSSEMYGSSSELGSSHNPLKASYGDRKEADGFGQLTSPSNSRGNLLSPHAASSTVDDVKKRHGACRKLRNGMRRLRKLLAYQVSIPLSFVIVLFSTFAQELFFTATPLIGYRYFGWSGAHSGILLGALAVCILPTNFVCERISRLYEERTVLKVSFTPRM